MPYGFIAGDNKSISTHDLLEEAIEMKEMIGGTQVEYREHLSELIEHLNWQVKHFNDKGGDSFMNSRFMKLE